MEMTLNNSFSTIYEYELNSINGGAKTSAVVNGVSGYALICVGMCLCNPIGWGIIAGGAYCMYNGLAHSK